MERNTQQGEREEGGQGGAGWPVVDIKKDGLAGYLALGMAMCPLVSLVSKNLI